jgi:aspartokinase-like uncharacterized kinase
MLDKLEYTKRLIGKDIYVLLDGGFFATVVDALDWETLLVEHNAHQYQVNIWDIRQPPLIAIA